MKRENINRANEIVNRLKTLDCDIHNLQVLKEEGINEVFPTKRITLNTPIVNLLDSEQHYDKIKELIDYSLKMKRKEYSNLEKELEKL